MEKRPFLILQNSLSLQNSNLTKHVQNYIQRETKVKEVMVRTDNEKGFQRSEIRHKWGSCLLWRSFLELSSMFHCGCKVKEGEARAPWPVVPVSTLVAIPVAAAAAVATVVATVTIVAAVTVIAPVSVVATVVASVPVVAPVVVMVAPIVRPAQSLS